MDLFGKLVQHHSKNIYPYHMPGHKRKAITKTLERLAELDITEIDGFDNLNHPEEYLLEVQRKAASVYGADESFYLVGGSTLGILSAISAVTTEGDTILIGRNCHKAVYHACYLRKLQPKYVFPEYNSSWDVFMQTTPEAVEEQLKRYPEIKAIVIVSPTYEGFCSDIKKIADLVHSYGKVLIVDEAHGAHLGFHDAWPLGAITQGADIVVQSLHKTLPSMTQTAIMHVKGDRIDCERLRRFIGIYQTSSPSYVFMASMEEAIDYMAEHGRESMDSFRQLWVTMIRRLETCECIDVFNVEGDSHDIGKLLISANKTGVDGQSLHQILRERFSLQMEMAQGKYVLAMFTVADEADAYERLTDALLTLDAEYKRLQTGEINDTHSEKAQCFSSDFLTETLMQNGGYQLHEAWDAESEWVNLEDCAGRCAGEFVNLYPPGVPLVVPGEIISQNMVNIIKEYCVLGLPVQGIKCIEGICQVNVLKRN